MFSTQHKITLSNLNLQELSEYLDNHSKKLFSENNPITILPWSEDNLPTPEEAMKVLDHYYPIELEHKILVNHINVLLNLTAKSHGVKQRAYFIHYIFRLLEVNTWIMSKHEKFRWTIKNKLKEFESGSYREGHEIAQEFAWMYELPEQQKCSECGFCGKFGPWTEFDGTSYYCGVCRSNCINQDEDPVDITKQLQELLDQTSDESIVSEWVREMCSKHSVISTDEYKLALQLRAILGEENFKYQMYEVEWGNLYTIRLR